MKKIDDHAYLCYKNNWASCLCEATRMEWSGWWWVYLWSIYIAKGKAIACVLIEIVDVVVAMESASMFNCNFISKSYIVSYHLDVLLHVLL